MGGLVERKYDRFFLAKGLFAGSLAVALSCESSPDHAGTAAGGASAHAGEGGLNGGSSGRGGAGASAHAGEGGLGLNGGSSGRGGAGHGGSYSSQVGPVMCDSVDSIPVYGQSCGIEGNHCHQIAYGYHDWYCCDRVWSPTPTCMPPSMPGASGEGGQGGESAQGGQGG